MKHTGILFILLMFFVSMACSNKDLTGAPMDNVTTLDLSPYPPKPPDKEINLLFIHHSTGGQLLAQVGEPVGDNSIYVTHPRGGGLRILLEQNNYTVHEASYGSIIGDKTDICHWNNKFKVLMDKILLCSGQNEFYTDGTKNRIIMFKSCYPNSYISSDGKDPGDPDSCEMTTANYKAAYNNLRKYFEKQPDTLFVAFTAPPLVEPIPTIKQRIKLLLGRMEPVENVGMRARAFNNWLKDVENGWLKDYPLKNIVVFDYYDILTGYGKSNWAMYPAGVRDSHPNSEGNTKAAREFIPFLNRTVHRMGL